MKGMHRSLLLLMTGLSLVACRNLSSNPSDLASSSSSQSSATSAKSSQEEATSSTKAESSRSATSQEASSSLATSQETTSQESSVETSSQETSRSQEVTSTSSAPSQTTQAPSTRQETTSQEASTPPPTSGGWADLSLGNLVIVNKQHALPRDYAPGENPQAGQAVRSLIADMQAQGFAISSSYSGFRSYDYQASLYQSYANRDGYALADTYSARPGYSEHQTGLAFDILSSSGALLGTSPQDSEAVTWLHSHAADYGFILRYPWGKEGITGYQYEAWHLRYVGDQAGPIAASGLTLEEYYGVPGGGY